MPGNGANMKWKLWTGVIAVFAAGAIVGGLSTTALIRGHYLHVMRSGPPRGVHKPIAERLTEDLGLTGGQRAEVDSIVSGFEPRFKEFESRTRVEVKAIMEEMEGRIRGVLTPEQQAKFDARIERMHEEMERRGKRGHRLGGEPHHRRAPGEGA